MRTSNSRGTPPAVEAAFEHDSGTDPEIRYQRKDGSQFWASVFVSPVCDENGAVVQHFVSFVDLTRHREENTRSKMLIDELNHRVKNMLAVVIAAVAIVVFVSGGVVAWPQAIVMIPGGALGGYAGVWIAKRVPQNAVRGFVVAVGVFLAFYYFVKG